MVEQPEDLFSRTNWLKNFFCYCTIHAANVHVNDQPCKTSSNSYEIMSLWIIAKISDL